MTDNATKLTVAVLAGGRSSRMGRDKALVDVDGQPLVRRVVQAALDAGFPVCVVGRPEQGLQEVLPPAVNLVFDLRRDEGPLMGLWTALEHTGGDVLLTGCDLPKIKSGDFQWLVAQARNADSQYGVIACRQGRAEPLLGIYMLAVGPMIRQLLEQGQRSMKGLLEARDFAYVELPEMHEGAVWDVDKPEQLGL